MSDARAAAWRIAVGVVVLGLPFAGLAQVRGDETVVDSDPTDEVVRIEAGEYTVQSSATRSDALPRVSAERHGLPHSPEFVLLNVTVLRDGMNVEAEIDAKATNLAQQTRAIEMQATWANDLVAYLGVVEIAPREVLTFELEIVPAGESEPIMVSYQRDFLPQTR